MIALWIVVLCLAAGHPAKANTCKDNRKESQYLPAGIGLENSKRKSRFVFLCDTVEVKAGKTTQVESGVMLYFAHPQRGNVIHVYGTLIFKGNKETWVYLSGSLDTARGKMEPGSAPWGGIVVEPGGQLIMEYTGVWGAPTPVSTLSWDVSIKNSFFTGANGIRKPDGTLLELEPNFAALNDVNFRRADEPTALAPVPLEKKSDKPQGLSAEEKASVLAKTPRKPFWSRNKILGLSGIVIAIGAGGYYLSQSHDDVPRQAKPAAAGMGAAPTFPPDR